MSCFFLFDQFVVSTVTTNLCQCRFQTCSLHGVTRLLCTGQFVLNTGSFLLARCLGCLRQAWGGNPPIFNGR